jgi:predicted phosphate transport protein (TIGR00153 family)
MDGAEVLKDLLDTFENVKEKARRIEEIEHKGDTLTHEIIKKLNTTFITPIDREDILALTSSIDDVIDLIHGAAYRIALYKLAESTPQAKALGFLILKSTRELHRGITHLSTKMDGVYAIAQLFDQEKDPIYILKWKEIYETLETATDRCEDAANVLEGVALKNA